MSLSSAAILHIVTDDAGKVFNSAMIQYFLRQIQYTAYTVEPQFKIFIPSRKLMIQLGGRPCTIFSLSLVSPRNW